MVASIEQVSGRTFDYVVIGGGTAGLVVATRLSEDPSTSVLVLEAGAANLDDPNLIQPAPFGSLLGSKYDWAFTTVPQKHCNDRSFPLNRGKSLGGSSAINSWLFQRAPKADIDAIEKLGNAGWNWEMLKRYYDRVEHFMDPIGQTETLRYDVAQHGREGPVTVAYGSVRSNLEFPYEQALENKGIPRNPEPFSGNIKGSWTSLLSMNPKDLVRSYVTNTYYQPVAHRENLVVLTDAHVSQILLAGKDGQDGLTATGVMFTHGGKEYRVILSKEVVLSAGALMTPQILELSGIGQVDILRDAGVSQKLDLPGVGQNLQEHILTPIHFAIRPERAAEFLTHDSLIDPVERSKQLGLRDLGTGAFRLFSANVAFVSMSSLGPEAVTMQDKLAKRVEEGIQGGKYSSSLAKQYRVQLDHLKAGEATGELIMSPAPGVHHIEPGKKHVTLYAMVSNPFSRGSIHIKSSDALEPPVIDPQYFKEEYDLESFVEMIKFLRSLALEKPLGDIIEKEVHPGAQVKDDAEIAEYVKSTTFTSWHTVGTCSMLPREDLGVVDNSLKVYGTTNLRVVDLSILPLHVGVHTQATAYAIGEIGADIIMGKFQPA